MAKQNKSVRIDFPGAKTNSNLPGFWEKRNDSPHFSYVELIAGPDFKPKKMQFLSNGQHLPASYHAIFIANIGDSILRVSRNSRDELTFQLCAINNIVRAGDKLTFETEEISNVNDPSDIIEKWGTGETKADLQLFLDAGKAKLDVDKVVSFYCLSV